MNNFNKRDTGFIGANYEKLFSKTAVKTHH